MGEEAADGGGEYARLASAADGGNEGDEGRALEWEIGLPSGDDLTPLSQPLVPPELAFAFSITPEPARTVLDLHRASLNTISSLLFYNPSSSSSSSSSAAGAAAAFLKSFPSFPSPAPTTDDHMVLQADDPVTMDVEAEPSLQVRWSGPPPASDAMGEAEPSPPQTDNSNDTHSARAPKRPRLVWTPQLQKRFIDVVSHLDIKHAVPKTIMQLMNVEGLTRENVASHLQKYRLYLKRMKGLSDEGPSSSSDHLFASVPVPQSLHEPPVPIHRPNAVPTMISMPVFGTPNHHGRRSPEGMVPVNSRQGSPAIHPLTL